ncbi:MAG: nucleoside monophosphate kinase [Nanoarchaeota archaeon]|nr:nucleoside monophosphate kinase [Nanoarchaeota archaeon]
MKLIFIGPQGSGKGTEAKIISKKLAISHISTGELFRNITGELKEKVNSYINQGELVPDELTIKILKERIIEPDCKNGFILDGFPRNIAQANILDKITKINKVIEITLNDELAIKRISSRLSCKKCGAVFNTITNPPEKENICDKCKGELYRRKDDNPEEIKKRLFIYHKETEPILEKYKDILITINGEQDIEKIAKEILEKIKE